MATAYTQADYQTLVAAIGQGALTVEYGDKKITYRSLAEMKEIKADMERELNVNRGPKRRRFISFSKGLQ